MQEPAKFPAPAEPDLSKKQDHLLPLWDIRCPICRRLLYVQSYEGTVNPITGQQFLTTRYVCPTEDLWITTQIPRRIAQQRWHQRCQFPDPAPDPEAATGQAERALSGEA